MSTDNAGDFSANGTAGAAHGPNWLQWLADLVGKPDVRGLELGTWRAEFGEWLLDNVLQGDGTRLIMVDTFEGSEEHKLAGLDCSLNLRQARERVERFGNKAIVLQSTTDKALRGVLREDHFDFIYVDAAHDAMNVLRDAVLAFDLLKPGGVMVFDDYLWTSMEQEIDRPRMAVDAFLSCYARRVEVIGVGWQVAVKKIA